MSKAAPPKLYVLPAIKYDLSDETKYLVKRRFPEIDDHGLPLKMWLWLENQIRLEQHYTPANEIMRCNNRAKLLLDYECGSPGQADESFCPWCAQEYPISAVRWERLRNTAAGDDDGY